MPKDNLFSLGTNLEGLDTRLDKDMDLDLSFDDTPKNQTVKTGAKIRIPGRIRKATVTRVVQGSPNGFPDRLDASLQKASFVLKRVDRRLFNVFEKNRGVEEYIGKVRL